MAGEGGQISKTIVEVYVETDSESEPYSSSDGEDGSEATLTAQEVVYEEAEVPRADESSGGREMVGSDNMVRVGLSPPALMTPSGELVGVVGGYEHLSNRTTY